MLYGNWTRALEGRYVPGKDSMIDPTYAEIQAIRSCLKYFGESAGEIGFDKPLGTYTEEEALQVIESIVTGYTEAMRTHHEATKFPPVRGLSPTPDPMQNPFSDMDNDIPWEEGNSGGKGK